MNDEKPKRKMRPGGGKSKGNAYESKVAKALSAALPINFIKSPGSGARVGGKNFATVGALMGAEALKLFSCDVVPVNEEAVGHRFCWSVECKFYKTSDSFSTLALGTANVWRWFEESVIDAAKTERKPMLIFRWNNSLNFVAVEEAASIPALLEVRGGPVNRHLFIYELEELLKHPEFWTRPI